MSADGNTALVGGDIDNGGAGAAWVFTTAVPPSPVTIASSPSGLAFTVSGVGCPAGSYTAPRTLVWSPASSCDVSFATPQIGTPGTQYTANFVTQYLLTTAASPVAGGSISPSTGTARIAVTVVFAPLLAVEDHLTLLRRK